MERLFTPDPDDGSPATSDAPRADAPLAARMRPRTVDDVVGQDELLAPGRPLRAAIDAELPHAMLLHGPPGSGKTTLSRIIASAAGAAVEALQAVDAGKAEVRAALQRARERRDATGTPTVLFIDEIHRFNRTQQDALLPAVEEGLVILIAATTEPAWSAVSPALRSRLRVYRLRALEAQDVLTLLRRAIERESLGPNVTADADALELLATRSGGDARTALGALEAAAALTRTALATLTGDADGGARGTGSGGGGCSGGSGAVEPDAGSTSSTGTPATPPKDETADASAADADDSGATAVPRAHPIRITARQAGAALDRAVVTAGPDQPHDLLSAYIKSIRGSDPDAAVYYLAGMLAAGEDPRTVARRLVVSASEDIGLADPQALPLAIAAAEVVDRVGMPECRIALSHATIRLALAGKSNTAYRAINDALAHVEEHGVGAPPPYLRGKISDGADPKAYDYPHSNPGGVSDQELLPPGLEGTRFVDPAAHETALRGRLDDMRRARGRTP